MIASRDIGELVPAMRPLVERMVADCAAVGIDLLVICTYRDDEAQAALYAQGRTVRGRIVTNARAGESAHNHRRAVDVVPLSCGKCVWDTRTPENNLMWHTIGTIGERLGLTWAGRWNGALREYGHFELKEGV